MFLQFPTANPQGFKTAMFIVFLMPKHEKSQLRQLITPHHSNIQIFYFFQIFVGHPVIGEYIVTNVPIVGK